MTEFLQQIIHPEMLPYTILLGLVCIYWFIVIIGAVDIDIFNFGDLGLDGAGESAEGLGDLGFEGVGESADGLGEVLEGASEAAEAVEGAGNSSSGIIEAITGYLNLGTVPVTIIGTFLFLQMWIFAYVAHVYLPESMKSWAPGIVFGIMLFLLITVVSLFLCGLTTRPFRKIFKHIPVYGHAKLVGKVCIIKSSKVTPTFGQAEMRVRDSFLILSVRCSEDTGFQKGDEAVIVNYNKEKDIYDLAKL
jgi:hypothetical protein